MSNLQRFLQSDEYPTLYGAGHIWDPSSTLMYSKAYSRFDDDQCLLQTPWQGKYEYPNLPWASPREEKVALDQDSTSSGSVWSPRASETFSEHETSHAHPLIPPTDMPGYGACGPIHLCSGFSGEPQYSDRKSIGYITPSDIHAYPDADADADAETEDFSADPRLHIPPAGPQYYAQPAGDGMIEPKSTLSIPVKDSGLGSSVHGTSIRSLSTDEDDAGMEDLNQEDEGSDYHPSRKRVKPNKTRRPARPPRLRSPNTPRHPSRKDSKSLTKPAKVSKKSSDPNPVLPAPNQNSCTICYQTLPSSSSLNKHIMTTHTRPFICTFTRYGCSATFGAKNEWKRHVFSQHLRPGVYRCDMGNCVPQPYHNRKKSSSSILLGRGDDADIFNEFNRKDLFTQHIRRMHGPASKAEKGTFEASLESIRRRCWIKLHDTPPRSICGFCLRPGQQGVAGKEVVFEGKSAWEDRMEHIGRHLEKGEKEEEEDVKLRDWMAAEGLLQWEAGLKTYRVVGIGGKRNASGEEDAEGESV